MRTRIGVVRVGAPAMCLVCLLLVGCSPQALSGGSATIASPTPSSPAPSPRPTVSPLLALQVAGAEQVVFDWTTNRCEESDIPDTPARAFRDAQGQVQLLAGHYTSRRAIGPDLNHLTHTCNVIMRSERSPDPARYADAEWINAVYTEDGRTIYAILHNEYEGNTHPGQCPSGQYFDCWYNAHTLAVSADGGASYHHAIAPPGHLVATLPYRYEAGAGPDGTFEGSNIVKAADGFYYKFIRIDDYRSERQWTCLMRTQTLAVPTSWRAWDGSGFGLAFLNPYQQPIADPRSRLCAPIDPEDIGVMHESVAFNPVFHCYVLVGTSADQIAGHEVWGIYYAFSTDLLQWSHRHLLLAAEFPWTYQKGDADPVLYPSLLDPASPSRNFETTGVRAYLYFTRFHYQSGQQTLDRDLIRVPVQFAG